jgi:hypothetical protein
MKVEQREDAIVFVPESEFEINALKTLRENSVKKMEWEDAWEQKGKFIVTFNQGWDR